LEGLVDLVPNRPIPARRVAEMDTEAERIRIDASLGSMTWRTWGKGRAILLLHGGSGSWSHWIRNISPLATYYRVSAPDMPGFGDSDNIPEPASTEIVADAVRVALSRVIGTEPVVIVGFSFGAMVGAWLAKKLPRQVTALVLVGAVGLGLRRNAIELHSWRRLADSAERRKAHRANLQALMIHDHDCIDELAIYLQQQNAERTRLNTRRFSRSNPLSENLTQIDVPLAAIWGEHDVTAAPFLDERREFLHRVRPGAPFEVIKNAGHWVQYEAADQFNAVLLRLLEVLQPNTGRTD